MNTQKYYVEDITFKDGTTRTDGKYPTRIGSIVTLESDLIAQKPLYFRYIKYNNGEVVADHVTRTSVVEDYDNYSNPGYLIIYTHNSIYTFKEISNDGDTNA